MLATNPRAIKNHITENCTYYTPINVEKYRGRPPIICRSSWETAMCRFLDNNSGVIAWASEEVAIRYQDPIEPIKNGKPKFRTYYPDFVMVTEQGTFLIEVKPDKQTRPPTRRSTQSRSTMITEEKAWRTNQAKWRAAENFCKSKGWTFKIITEKELFGR